MVKQRQKSKVLGGSKELHAGFEQSFSSEALLQQAIARLLTRMPAITGVQILQGPQELGKDLIFYTPGAFGEPLLCACVVKNSRITGNASTQGGARTVFHQAEQAFDSPHVNSSGEEVRVQRVYIITPYEISQPAITSIVGRLRERAGQVVFMGGSVLFEKFKEYWPDYFADEAELIARHLEDTKRAAESEENLQGLANQYNLGALKSYATKIYVKQNLHLDIRNCELGPALSQPLPNIRTFTKNFSRDDMRYFDEKLNELRKSVLFLTEWGLCGTAEKETVFDLSSTVMNQLRSVWSKYEAELEVYKELLVVREGKRSAEGSKNYSAKDSTRLAREIERLEKHIAKLINERKQIFGLIEGDMNRLASARAAALSILRSRLRHLKQTVLGRRLGGLEALSNNDYARAGVFNNCLKAAPPGVFNLKKGVRVNLSKNILDLWDGDLLIVGAPGFGKTSFCRWHALQDAENFTSGRNMVVPVYVPLYRLSKMPIASFQETFLKNLGKSALIGEAGGAANAKIRLYLDGLDEIASAEQRRAIVELARTRGDERDKQKFQIVLTSRDYIFAPWLDWCPRVTIGGFEEEDIQELVIRWLDASTESYTAFWKQINAIPSLLQLMHTPLLATLILMVFRQTGKLPESKSRLYEIFVNLLSGGWDLAKGVLRESKFGERVKVLVLTTLATNLHNERKREFRVTDVRSAMDSVLRKANDTEQELLQNELITDGLVTKSGDVLQLAHHSFQEFLTAKDLMGSPQPFRANKALDAFLTGDEWWKEVIQFYIGLSSNPHEIVAWLKERMGQSRSYSSRISAAQIDALRSSVLEAFPEFPSDEVAPLKYYIN